MSSRIGYYVHHQGDGHRQRAMAIARHAPDRFVLLGTGLAGRAEALTCVDLPDDRMATDLAFEGRDRAADRALALHYAPHGHAGVRERVAVVAAWIAETRPSLMVVDVSVEIAMLARLAATPTVYVRLAGTRNDPAHLEAFRAAAALIAPFAEALDGAACPTWVRDKTHYVAGLVRPTIAVGPTPSGDVVVVVGRGGSSISGEVLAGAASATPDRRWTVLGEVGPPANCPPNLDFMGWTPDAEDRLAHARVVVGAAGDGVVNAVLAADRPFVCIPEARPFDEQVSKARRLDTLGAAIVLETLPPSTAWPSILAAAEALPSSARQLLHSAGGDATAAALILATADAQHVRSAEDASPT